MTPMVWCNEADKSGENLQRLDPLNGPRSAWVSNSSSSNNLRGVSWDSVPFNFWWNVWNCIYGCFRKWWYPQIIHFNRVFHYKPSNLGYPPTYLVHQGSKKKRFPWLFSFRGCLGANLIKNNRELEDQGTKIMDQFYRPYHGSMVYLPTWMVEFYGKNVGTKIPYMDPMGCYILSILSDFLQNYGKKVPSQSRQVRINGSMNSHLIYKRE